jgi:toxin-antitoxin system PIN domain toxin
VTFLLDVNVLMAITWPSHVAHGKAQSWFIETGKAGWVTSPATESGFIRLSSNPLVVSDVVAPNTCAAVLESLKQIGTYRFVADEVSLAGELARSEVPLTGHRQVSDAHLAIVAHVHNCVFATLDKGAAALAQRFGAEALLIETW